MDAIEANTLAHYEAIVERHQEGFMAAAEALVAIRDQKLYRQTHDNFEDYCQERWGFTANYARRQITAAEVATQLKSENVPVGTLSERVLREVSNVPKEKRLEVLDKATQASKGKPTAKAIKEAKESSGLGRVPYGKPFGELKGGSVESKERPARAKKNGAEKVPAKLRLAAEAAFGKLMAVLSKMGLTDEIGDELEAVIKAIKRA